MNFIVRSIKCRGNSNIPIDCYTLKEVIDVKLKKGKKYMIRDLTNRRNKEAMAWKTVICDFNFERFISFKKEYHINILKIDLLMGNYEVKDYKTREILEFETKYKKKLGG